VLLGDGVGLSSADRKSYNFGTITKDLLMHIVVVANSFSDIEMWVNGSEVASSGITGTGTSVSASGGALMVGRRRQTGNSMQSDLSNIAWYPGTALNSTEINAHYDAGVEPLPVGGTSDLFAIMLGCNS
jgi:hypothetical protein